MCRKNIERARMRGSENFGVWNLHRQGRARDQRVDSWLPIAARKSLARLSAGVTALPEANFRPNEGRSLVKSQPST